MSIGNSTNMPYREVKYFHSENAHEDSQNPTPVSSHVLRDYLSLGVATNPELIGAVPKKPTRTPLSLMPLTIVVPTPSGSSIDWNILVVTVCTNPCVAFELSVYNPTTCPLLFRPKACVPVEAGKLRTSKWPWIIRKP